MKYSSIRHMSYSISVAFHIVLIILLMLITFSMDYAAKEYVELSFGESNETGSSGAVGTRIDKIEEAPKPQKENETPDKSAEVKEVKLPEAKNSAEEEVVTPADKEKEVSTTSKTETEETADSEVKSEGQGNLADAEGSFGFDIDWGGKGKRKILYYYIPDYPAGVQKEADIRLKFSILPDGSIGTIFPLTKADTRLENSAINALRQWSFEPLSAVQKQVEQSAVIVFPYRLQ